MDIYKYILYRRKPQAEFLLIYYAWTSLCHFFEDGTGHKSQGTRYQGTTPQGTGHRTQGTRHRAQGTGHQGTGHKARSTRAPGHWSTGYQSTGHQGTGHQGTGHQGTGRTKKNPAKRIAKQYIRNETGAQGEPFQEPSLGTRSRPDTTPKGHKKRKPLRQAELRKYLISDVMIYIYICVCIYIVVAEFVRGQRLPAEQPLSDHSCHGPQKKSFRRWGCQQSLRSHR